MRGTVDNVNEETYTDIPDVAFRCTGGQWIFNMATSNLQKNTTYTFRINLKDGSYISFQPARSNARDSSAPRETSAGRRNPPGAFFFCR